MATYISIFCTGKPVDLLRKRTVTAIKETRRKYTDFYDERSGNKSTKTNQL